MSVTEFLNKIFQKISAAWWKLINRQRDILSKAQENDDRLQVRLDRVNPENYVSINYDGVDITMRKDEMFVWSEMNRERKRHFAAKVKNKIKKGELVYKQFGNVKLLVDPKQVLNPNNEL